MLRRRSTKSKQQRPLGRSKSTSSIAQKSICSLHSDPSGAEREAHIAARLSYQRAQGRRSGEMGSTGLPPRPASSVDVPDRTVSRRDFALSDNTYDLSRSSRDTPVLSHQRSVRFTGPTAQRRRPVGPRVMESRASLLSTPGDNPRMERFGRQTRSNFSDSIDASTIRSSLDLVGQSPYRKVRKSRSMFTASEPSNTGYSFTNSPVEVKGGAVPSRYSSLVKGEAPREEFRLRTLRAPKSMSFLRGRQEPPSSHATTRAQHDLAVQLAREQYHEQVLGRPKLRSHSSSFFGAKRRGADSSASVRTSLRNSSNTSAALGPSYSGNSLHVPKQGTLRTKARRVSQTIKTKLKGMFSRQSSRGDPDRNGNWPLEANGFGHGSYLQFDPPEPHEEASMSRGPSRIASLHAVPSSQQLRSRQGSLESYEAQDTTVDDKSRVTSWTDSVTNPAASPVVDIERAYPRLSVIREAGPHASSDNYAFSTAYSNSTPCKGKTVDSQRIYSALMKRANEAKHQEDQGKKFTAGEMRTIGRLPPRSSSIDQLRPSGWSPPTIRCVQTDDDVFLDGEHKQAAGSGSPGKTMATTQSPYFQDSPHDSPNPWLKKDIERPPSPGKSSIASHASRTRSITQRSSAFFASPSNHLFRTASPYRRALQESMRASELGEDEVTISERRTDHLGSSSCIILPERHHQIGESQGYRAGLYADSVYSENDEGLGPNASIMDKFPEPPEAKGHGDATIFPQTRRATHVLPRRDVSEVSSVEWKTWLSSHVAKIEDCGPKLSDDLASNFSRPLPRSGHIREKAEIDSPTDPVPNIQASNLTPTTTDIAALRPLHSDTRSGGSQHAPARARRVTPGVENEAPSEGSRRFAKTTDLTPPKQRFRTVPSLPILSTRQPGIAIDWENAVLRQSASANTISSASPYKRDDLTSQRRARLRQSGALSSSTKSSPGLTAAVEKQFGKASNGSPYKKTLNGALSAGKSPASASNSANQAGKALSLESLESQALSSREIVDMFLSSRRKRMEGELIGDTDGDDASSGAFV